MPARVCAYVAARRALLAAHPPYTRVCMRVCLRAFACARARVCFFACEYMHVHSRHQGVLIYSNELGENNERMGVRGGGGACRGVGTFFGCRFIPYTKPPPTPTTCFFHICK